MIKHSAIWAGITLLAAAQTATADACHDLAMALRKADKPIRVVDIPGVESEQVINSFGSDGDGFHPVLQGDKARLLAEAAKNDPSRLDLWKILLASSARELAGQDFEQFEVRELKSRHMGRLVLSRGGTDDCAVVSDYYTDASGKVRIETASPPSESMDGYDICERSDSDTLIGWHDQVFSASQTLSDDTDVNYDLSAWQGDGKWQYQCRIEATYHFAYTPGPGEVYGSSAQVTDFAKNPYNQLMAAQVDTWGHLYGPFDYTRSQAKLEPEQIKLFTDFAERHRDKVDLERLLAFRTAIIAARPPYDTDDAAFIPVFNQGETVMVTMQGQLHGGVDGPDVNLMLFRLNGAKAVVSGGIAATRTAAGLDKLTVTRSDGAPNPQ